MKLFKGSLLVLVVFSFIALFSLLPASVNSAYVWEQCTSAITCGTKTIGITEWQCHKSAVTGNWQWDKQPGVQAEVESDKNVAGICSDGYDNNCNTAIDSADATDCMPPSSSVASVEGDTSATYYDTSPDFDTDVLVYIYDESSIIGTACKWYVLQSGYDSSTGSACNYVSTNVRECELSHGSTQGAKTAYVACIDENKNGQPYTNGYDARTSKKIEWIGDWTVPSVTFTTGKPADQTGTPYDIEITISDAYSGVQKSTIKVWVSNDDGATWIDKTSAWFPVISGSCETAGNDCTLAYTVSAGDEALDGYHKIKVEAADNAGNAITPPVRRYLVSTCRLDSASIAPSSSCSKSIDICTAAGTACNGGDAIDVTAKYTGLSCPASFTVQIDAKSADNLCNVQGSGGQMNGISITCSNPTPSVSQKTCIGTWTLPSPVPPACQQKTITSKSGPNDACINGNWCTAPSGLFGACKDTTPPAITFDASNPATISGRPFSIKFTVSDAQPGVDNLLPSNGIILKLDGAAQTYALLSPCDTPGSMCSIEKNNVDLADGDHTITVTATDKQGNSKTETKTFTVSTCTLNSVKATAGPSCNSALNNCAVVGAACGTGETFAIEAKYAGVECPTSFNVQIDAESEDNSCTIQDSGGDMQGMLISCANAGPVAGERTCTGSWTLPMPVHPDCQQRAVSPTAACLKKPNGDICIFSGLGGSPGMCKDTSDTINLQLSLQSDVGCVATRSISATTMSAIDAVYGLASCRLEWKDGATVVKTVTKTCDAVDTKADCAVKFTPADKSYSYSSDGTKSATLTCTNVNSATKPMTKSVTADTSTPAAGVIRAYKDNTKVVAITGSGWQTDVDPYFEWDVATSLCGMKYYVTTDGTEPDATKTERTTNNYIHPSNFGNAKHQMKAKPLSGAGVWGTTQTFNLWVDTIAPITSIQESIPTWFTIAPTLHLACADNPAAPADNSGCSSTQYCLTVGCTPGTTYTVAGITLSSSATLSYRSTDGAGNVEASVSRLVQVDTTVPDISNLKAYTDDGKSTAIPGGVWQKDTDPYFEWGAISTPSGIRYYITTDGTTPVETSTSTTDNFKNALAFSNGKSVVNVRAKTGAGAWGSTSTFNLWADTAAPTTSITETIQAWFTSAPTLHLACADKPDGAAGTANSDCASTQYCTGAGCALQSYSGAIGPLPDSTMLYFKSTDNAGNAEATKTQSINVDTSPPPMPTVTDSGIFTSDQTKLTFSWAQVTDSQSGISGYQYAIGTCANPAQACFTDIKVYTDAAWTPSVTISGLILADGTKYYIHVRARNGAGTFSAAGSSDGIIVDARGPSGIDSLVLERSYGGYASGPFAVFTLPRMPLPSLSDPSGVNTDSCKYTVDDGNTWKDANWNATDSSCKINKINCNDGDAFQVKMRVSDLLGNSVETSTASNVICDKNPPDTPVLIPSNRATPHTAIKDVSFSATTKDAKSGVDVIEWELHRIRGGDSIVGTKTADCDAGKDVSVTCDFKSSVFLVPDDLKNGDRLYVKARADDHVDPWSGWGKSGQWLIDFDAPVISAITPTTATLGAPQSYSANVKAQTGKTIASCGLIANGEQASSMALTSGTTFDGIWSGPYTITVPIITFMRAHCQDSLGNQGDGVDVPVSLATGTTSSVRPSPVEKLQITNITARYMTNGGSFITGGKCWISSSGFNDPAAGIVGAGLQDINDGYYTYSFAAPAISGTYNYGVSCAKTGYQTTSSTNSFTVLGCEGPVCIRVAPANTIAILKLGETQNINLNLKNRDNVENIYSVSLVSSNPNVAVGIAPISVALKNGEEKKVNVQLTSLIINDQPITLNILVKNTDIANKPGDYAAVTINSSIAVGSVPDLGALEILAIFAAASLLIYRKTKI